MLSFSFAGYSISYDASTNCGNKLNKTRSSGKLVISPLFWKTSRVGKVSEGGASHFRQSYANVILERINQFLKLCQEFFKFNKFDFRTTNSKYPRVNILIEVIRFFKIAKKLSRRNRRNLVDAV